MDFDMIEKLSDEEIYYEYENIISSTCYCNCTDGHVGVDIYASDRSEHVCSSYHAVKACGSNSPVYCSCR